MDIQHTDTAFLIAALLFVVGLVILIALNRSHKRTVRVKNGAGIFIAGDGNSGISNQTNSTSSDTHAMPWWQKIVTILACLATLAGVLIAGLAYWFPRGAV